MYSDVIEKNVNMNVLYVCMTCIVCTSYVMYCDSSNKDSVAEDSS